MTYLNEREREIIAWFSDVEKQVTSHGGTGKLDRLGSLALALPAEANEAAVAWFDALPAMAKERGAFVSFLGHGTMVLVLPRHAPAQGKALELPLSEG